MAEAIDPSEWRTAVDEGSGLMYYYHATTMETSWVWPPTAPGGSRAPEQSEIQKRLKRLRERMRTLEVVGAGNTAPLPPLALEQPAGALPERWASFVAWQEGMAAGQGGAGGGGAAAAAGKAGDEPAAPAKAKATAAAADKGKRRRANIMAENNLDETYEKKVYPKSDASRAAIQSALDSHFLFATLSAEQLSELIDAMFPRDLVCGEVIIEQGDKGDNFYVCEQGQFDIFVNGTCVYTTPEGAAFGELALLYNAPRAATCTVKTATAKVWALDRVAFRHILAHASNKSLLEVKAALKKVPILASLTEEQCTRVAAAVTMSTFAPGEHIIRKGERGNTFYMVKEGSVTVTDIGSGAARINDLDLPAGACFGERALLTDEPRAATVLAKTETTLMVLDRQAFNELLGPLRELMAQHLQVTVLKTIPALQHLPEATHLALCKRFTSETFAPGAPLFAAGAPCDRFFILQEGSVVLDDGSAVGEGDYLAAAALDRAASAHATGASVAAGDKPVVAQVLLRGDFLEGVAASALAGPGGGGGGPGEEQQAGEQKQAEADAALRDVPFGELEVLKPLGMGTFGLVKLVKWANPETGEDEAFALKILQKQQVVEFNQQDNVMNEKNIMRLAQHPFILRLAGTYQDKDSLYMLLELIQGGELFTYLANIGGPIPSDDARFFAACVLDALAYLHDKRILYRDLKPENLMIDSRGYIRVVDYGFAKIVEERTYTLCGTPEYLAPELVLGQGYGKSVDYWALGILIYEMLCGDSPFAAESGDHMDICRNILHATLAFPEELRDRKAKSLITKLLHRDPVHRLGCLVDGADGIRGTKWFRDVDWDALRRKEITPPWVPPLANILDTSQFDMTEEEAEEEHGHLEYDGDQEWAGDFGPWTA